ncbi:MAG: hypothetical protein A2283_17385 [Lentisphaerae bacterium RIFOXYA12_FULL_48_11]|nr:MAG: hypothetical protein A2259_01550 [Candidatus Moranbacteria bacterium RIFOXYA2_FULL_43_15]OGV68326.1 MAG: hypothetical protein A2283_17385 [Lentisphaerae bacterium RIFOXYA12_FULL_48_11]
MDNKKISTVLGAIVLVVIAVTAGAFVYRYEKTQNRDTPDYSGNAKSGRSDKPLGNGAECTAEAKICPDGSAVGRSGPNCEFVECPNEVSDVNTNSWKTYRNEKYGFKFEYPGSLKIEVQDFEEEGLPGGIIWGVDLENGVSVSVNEIEKGSRNGVDPLSEPNGMDPVFQEDIKIDGQKARVYNGGEAYVVAKNGYQYFLFLFEPEESDKDVLSKIVSTFKFTK